MLYNCNRKRALSMLVLMVMIALLVAPTIAAADWYTGSIALAQDLAQKARNILSAVAAVAFIVGGAIRYFATSEKNKTIGNGLMIGALVAAVIALVAQGIIQYVTSFY